MNAVLLGQEETPYKVAIPPSIGIDGDKFRLFCQANRDLRIEQDASGEIIIMPPAGSETARRNLSIAAQLYAWSEADGKWVAFDSSAGFELPNGATRSPDASWVRRARWEGLTVADQERFVPLCPDFVMELRSKTDSLADLQGKMTEYIENGAGLGWLIDPFSQEVHVYRPGTDPEIRLKPESLSGDPELPGFALNLAAVW
jgi:Uma2 family endonuclease